ncbi:MAG TPA: hypothetical protein IAC34_01475 [Candidatus Coprenecus stercoripullorum]|nr:hypothetical protein [Candidatus Coprenecus stercoripullorum]
MGRLIFLLRLGLAALPGFLSVGQTALARPHTVRGGDMTFYEIYRQLWEDGDRRNAAANAGIFLSTADSSCLEPALAALADTLAEYYEKEEYDFTEALKWAEYSFRIYSGLGRGYRYQSAKEEYRLARLWYLKGEYHRTLGSVTRAMKEFERKGLSPELLYCYNLLGAVHYACRDYDEAAMWFRKFSDKARELNDTSIMAVALNNLAAYNNQLSDSLKSRNLVAESIRLSRKAGDSAHLCRFYLNIADLLFQAV